MVLSFLRKFLVFKAKDNGGFSIKVSVAEGQAIKTSGFNAGAFAIKGGMYDN